MGEVDEQLSDLASRWRERWPGRIVVEVRGLTPRMPVTMLTLTNTENGKDVVHVFEDNGAVVVDDGRKYRDEIPIWSDWQGAVEELVADFVNRATS